MKCVKHKTTGEIKRLSEERATKLVAGGNWQFILKKEWKLQRPVKDFNSFLLKPLIISTKPLLLNDLRRFEVCLSRGAEKEAK